MIQFRFCTFIGVDQFTDLDQLKKLSQDRVVEWGFLYSEGRQGAENRYPPIAWLESTSATFKEFPEKAQFALHVCGTSYVIDLLTSTDVGAFDRFFNLAKNFNRIQLNFNGKSAMNKGVTSAHFDQFIKKLQALNPAFNGVIVQSNAANNQLISNNLWTQVMSGTISLLADSSGGAGKAPSNWNTLLDQAKEIRAKKNGYAGGLGPGSVKEVLATIFRHQVSERGFWIDMEGRLRNSDDKFDLTCVETVLKEVDEELLVISKELATKWATYSRVTTDEVAVSELDSFMSSWWASKAIGWNPVIPPENACKPMHFSRIAGEFDSLSYLYSLEDEVLLRGLTISARAALPSEVPTDTPDEDDEYVEPSKVLAIWSVTGKSKDGLIDVESKGTSKAITLEKAIIAYEMQSYKVPTDLSKSDSFLKIKLR